MFFKPKIERDPNIRKLEQDVFAQIQEIVKSQSLSSEEDSRYCSSAIQFVSFEQALMELREFAQKNK
jgi:hypothetical protein